MEHLVLDFASPELGTTSGSLMACHFGKGYNWIMLNIIQQMLRVVLSECNTGGSRSKTGVVVAEPRPRGVFAHIPFVE